MIVHFKSTCVLHSILYSDWWHCCIMQILRNDSQMILNCFFKCFCSFFKYKLIFIKCFQIDKIWFAIKSVLSHCVSIVGGTCNGCFSNGCVILMTIDLWDLNHISQLPSHLKDINTVSKVWYQSEFNFFCIKFLVKYLKYCLFGLNIQKMLHGESKSESRYTYLSNGYMVDWQLLRRTTTTLTMQHENSDKCDYEDIGNVATWPWASWPNWYFLLIFV